MIRLALLLLLAVVLPAAEKTVSPLVGAWRLWSTEGGSAFQYRVTWKAVSGGVSGMAMVSTGLPDDLADQIAKGKRPPKVPEYPEAVLVGLTLDAKLEADGTVTIVGRDLKKLINGERIVLATWKGTLTPAGVIVAKDGKDAKRNIQVLGAKEDAWKVPADAAPATPGTSEVSCLDGAVPYHYTLHVPKSYDPAKPPPLIVWFSPAGGAKPMHTSLMEELGWVSIGLTEAKNGDWEPITQNRDAALFDLRRRLAVDWTKVRFGGSSGGGRASLRSATTWPGITVGVFAIVAGSSPSGPQDPPASIPVFYITGKTDMNLSDCKDAMERNKKTGRPCEIIIHDGGHESGGKDNEIAGLKWLAAHEPVGAAPAKKR